MLCCVCVCALVLRAQRRAVKTDCFQHPPPPPSLSNWAAHNVCDGENLCSRSDRDSATFCAARSHTHAYAFTVSSSVRSCVHPVFLSPHFHFAWREFGVCAVFNDVVDVEFTIHTVKSYQIPRTLDQTPPNVFRTHKYCMHTAIRLLSSKPKKKKPILHRRIPSRRIHFQTGWEFMTSIRKSPTQIHGVPTADLSLPSLLQPRALLLPLPARLAR